MAPWQQHARHADVRREHKVFHVCVFQIPSVQWSPKSIHTLLGVSIISTVWLLHSCIPDDDDNQIWIKSKQTKYDPVRGLLLNQHRWPPFTDCLLRIENAG